MIKELLVNNNFYLIFIFLFFIAGSVLLSDFLKKKKALKKSEILRKTPHILIGILFFLSPFFLNQAEIITSAMLLVLGVFTAKISPFFNTIFSIERKTYGIWLTPIALGLMAFLWLPENRLTFLFGILVLTFSDAFAALFGNIFGKKKVPFFKKTFAGSLAFFISTFLIIFSISPEIKIWEFIWISLVLTLIEFIFIFGLDNLFLPIVASILFYHFII